MSLVKQDFRAVISKSSEFHDLLLKNSSKADIFQTGNWGKLNMEKGYGDIFYISIFSDSTEPPDFLDSPESLDSLGLENSPQDIPLISAQIHLNSAKLIGKWAYIQHGPIFRDDLLTQFKDSNWAEQWNQLNFVSGEYAQKLWLYFLSELEIWSKQKNAFAIIMEPLAAKNSDFAKLIFKKSGEYNFIEEQNWVLPKYPLYIDLQKDEQDILASFSKNTRYYIRYAQRKGVEIDYYYPNSQDENASTNEYFQAFLRLLNTASDRQDYNIPSEKYFVKSLELFKDTNNLLIAVAKVDDDIISANFTQIYGNWAGSYYTANSRKYSKLRASYLLKFATQMEAKRKGVKVFDMWGYLPGIDKTHPQYGYGQFKKGFEPIDSPMIGRLSYVMDKFRYQSWKLAGKIKR